MRQIVPTTQFKRDARLMQRRGLALDELRAVARQIAEGEPLAPTYRDHKLTGPLRDCRECHIRPDWLLVYRLSDAELVLVRTGTHADLFGKWARTLGLHRRPTSKCRRRSRTMLSCVRSACAVRART